MNAQLSSLVSFLFLTILSFPVYAQDASENLVAEKMAELEWHVGKWQQKGTWLPNGNEVTAMINCQWMLEKTTIMCENSDLETPEKVSSFFMLSYDPALNNYVSTSFHPMLGRPLLGNVIKNGESWSMQGGVIDTNLKIWNNMVMTPQGESIDVVQYRSTNGGEVIKVQEATIIPM